MKIKKISIKIFLTFLIIFFLFSLIPDSSSVIFTFNLEDTGEIIEGEVFLDNFSIGRTLNGDIALPKLTYLPEEIKFKGKYNGQEFEVIYDFPNNYMDYDNLPFLVSLDDIENYNGMYADAFSHTNETHWSHMPLTYNYDEECEFKLTLLNGTYIKIKDEEVIGQIERGLEFINERTNGAITFKKIGEEFPDIMYVCDLSNRKDYTNDFEFVPEYYTEELLGEAQIYTYSNTNLFAPGEVYLIRLGEEVCADTKPIIVIHETLHMLGLEHRNYLGDIMHPTIREDCKAEISKNHIDYLWSIYDPNSIYKPYKSKYNCGFSYYSCSDFATQKDAQEALEFCGLEKDIHKLDIEKDGLACENLP